MSLKPMFTMVAAVVVLLTLAASPAAAKKTNISVGIGDQSADMFAN